MKLLHLLAITAILIYFIRKYGAKLYIEVPRQMRQKTDRVLINRRRYMSRFSAMEGKRALQSKFRKWFGRLKI